jgi:flagellar basal-body rod modification protein FlgD
MTTPVTNTPQNPAASSSGASSNSDAMSQLSGNFNTFLTLLTSQLKNQDPTSPMDSSTFTQQLVEYSQVEQQINTNTNLQTLITQGSTNLGTYATSYLGKAVSITNGNASLTNGAATWNYSLATTASSNTLTVADSTGKVVYSGNGETGSGVHQFNWNGQDNNGNQLDDGTYTLTVTAKASDGSGITTSVASAGVVSEIDMTSGTPQLLLNGGMEIGLGDIANVANVPAATN